jgi:hypothetical protein
MQKEKNNPPDHSDTVSIQKLLVSELIQLEQDAEAVRVQRGMPIRAADETAVGVVAAVVLDCRSRKVTHLLLGQVPPTAVYRLIPLSLIDRIDGETVCLRTTASKIVHLPLHQPEA